MTQRSRVASVSDIPADRGHVVRFDGEEVAIFCIDGHYFACSARCPHAGGPLADGFIDGTSVVCPWHGWSFELNCVGNAPRDGVERYRVSREGDDIYIES